MELTGKLSPEEFRDVGRMLRTRWTVVKWLVKTSHGLLIFVALLYATAAALVVRDFSHWKAMTLIWSVVAGVSVWNYRAARRERKQTQMSFNAARGERIQLGIDAVITRSTNGMHSSIPWSSFDGWREKGSVVLLKMKDHDGVYILPVAKLSAVDRENLRGLLSSKITGTQQA